MGEMIKYESRHEEKQLRRIMLDVMEICPAKYRREMLLNVRLIQDARNTELDGLGIYDLLDFLHRLQISRISKTFTPHQERCIRHIINWSNGFYFKRSKRNYVQPSRVERYEKYKKEKSEPVKFEIIEVSFLYFHMMHVGILMIIAAVLLIPLAFSLHYILSM